MGIPIYPTVHLQVDTDFPEAFATNTVRLTLTTAVPHELVDQFDACNVVVEELLGKAKELIRGRKELTDGGS